MANEKKKGLLLLRKQGGPEQILFFSYFMASSVYTNVQFSGLIMLTLSLVSTYVFIIRRNTQFHPFS